MSKQQSQSKRNKKVSTLSFLYKSETKVFMNLLICYFLFFISKFYPILNVFKLKSFSFETLNKTR